MIKPTIVFAFLMSFLWANAQESSLPADLRQHAVTQYNASLFNPTFSLNRNTQSASLWTRWQWQMVDSDPTTLFANYTTKLGESSAAGLGFFQHNTGVYFNTGGALNFAYELEFNRLIKLSVGANVFGFVQEIADTRFQTNPIPGIPQTSVADAFIIQVAPGINLSVENFSLSLASENLFDYNMTRKEVNTVNADKIFMGMASYDFPVMASDSTAFIRPSVYLRTIPEQSNQVGINTLFSTQKYWAQAGYNNFYGISAGLGGTFFDKFSLGALVEFGTSGSVNNTDPSFEIIASFYLGKPDARRAVVASGMDLFNNSIEQDVELTTEEMQEQMRKAEAAANNRNKVDEELELPEESEAIVDTNEEYDKQELKRIAAEEKIIERQQRKDAIAAKKLKEQEERLAEREAKRNNEQNKEEILAANRKAEEEKIDEQVVLVEAQRKRDSISNVEKRRTIEQAAAIEEEQRLAEIKESESILKRKNDSIANIAEQIRLAKQSENVTPRAGEKYQEVVNEEGLEPGFYLIANVFGTKKYFDAFINDLAKKGIQGKSFYRSINKYNYAYLERYDTMAEARRARENNFNGKYSGKTWIFRARKK